MELLTLAGALVMGSFAFYAFWILALIVFVVSIALTENEHYGWVIAMFVVGFIALGAANIFNLYAYTLANPWSLARGFGYYVGVALVWGAFKWWHYCVKQRKLYEVAKADFLKSENATDFTSTLRVKWTQKLENASRYDRHYVLHSEAPLASENKEKILNWMGLWPFSMLGSVFSDLIIHIWDTLYNWMGGIYDTISRSVWKGTENDLASQEELATARKSGYWPPNL